MLYLILNICIIYIYSLSNSYSISFILNGSEEGNSYILEIMEVTCPHILLYLSINNIVNMPIIVFCILYVVSSEYLNFSLLILLFPIIKISLLE